MKTLSRFKWPLSLLLSGFLVRVIGSMMKILHWQHADSTLITATCIIAAAIVWLIIRLLITRPVQ